MYWFALGNSLTLHGKCDYWWNEIGMAATDAGHDYVSVLSGRLPDCEVRRLNFASWETKTENRDELLPGLLPYLTPAPDMITVQLSENAGDLTGFEDDLVSLLEYLKEKCPGAFILLVDDFWNEEKSKLKRSAARRTGVPFADLAELRADPGTYQCGLGTQVRGDDGSLHTVGHKGVAAHPGDRGMEALADAILKVYMENCREERSMASFVRSETPLITAMIQMHTPETCIRKIKASLAAGAEAFGIQLCQIEPKYRTGEHLSEIFKACEGRPIYVTSYRVGYSKGMTDEECADLLLLALESGATLIDVFADIYCEDPNGITWDAEAVAKQKALIDRIHAGGGEVLISTHDRRPLTEEEILRIGRAQVERGTDVVKIVVTDDDISQLPRYVSALQKLVAEMGRKVLFLPSGPCGVFLRRIGIELGCCMALTVAYHDEIDTVQQPTIEEVRVIRDAMTGKLRKEIRTE